MGLLHLERDRVLLVRGPARVRVEEGSLMVLGSDRSREIEVRRGRILPLETSESAGVMVTTWDTGGLSLTSGDIGTRIWDGIENHLFEGRRNRVLIVGETDSGKSALASFLANRALGRGTRVGLVDGDIGQGDLAPPGSIGASIIDEPILDPRDEEGEFISFVGATSPRGFEHITVAGMIDALAYIESKDPDLAIVNTDGYVREGGEWFKVDLARAMKPDLLIVTGGAAQDNLMAKFEGLEEVGRLLKAKRPEGIVKTSSEREEGRLSQYKRFLRGSRSLMLRMSNLGISFLGINSQTMEIDDSASADPSLLSRESDILIDPLVGDFIKILDRPRKKVIVPENLLEGMFVGLGDDERVLGFGRIDGKSGGMLGISASLSRFDTIHLSTIGLSRDLAEEYTIPLKG